MPLSPGELVPAFSCRTSVNDRFVFDTLAGRYLVLCFFGSAGDPGAARLLQGIRDLRRRLDSADVGFFGVTNDPDDVALGRIRDEDIGGRFFWDFDRRVSALFGAVTEDDRPRPTTFVIDDGLRLLAALPFDGGADAHLAALSGVLGRLAPLGEAFPARTQAPVLVVPRVFEPEFCRRLVRYYEDTGGKESGFMRDVDGRTREIIEHRHKRRRDCNIEDEDLRRACMRRIFHRLVPQIKKAYQYQVTRIERHIVACYDAREDGHFRAHRDNTTKGTAHRRFAVSLFLNTGEYEGGALRFPEYGRGLYSAPAGGAVVFSCSMLHEAGKVTHGRRYMYLPFLYDDEARRIREENLQYLDVGNGERRDMAEGAAAGE